MNPQILDEIKLCLVISFIKRLHYHKIEGLATVTASVECGKSLGLFGPVDLHNTKLKKDFSLRK